MPRPGPRWGRRRPDRTRGRRRDGRPNAGSWKGYGRRVSGLLFAVVQELQEYGRGWGKINRCGCEPGRLLTRIGALRRGSGKAATRTDPSALAAPISKKIPD